MSFPILPLLPKTPPGLGLPKLAVHGLLATFLHLVVGPLYEGIPRLAFAHLNGRQTSSTARTTSSPRHTTQTMTLPCALVFRRCFLVLPQPEVYRNQNRNPHRLGLLGLNQPHFDWYLNLWLWEKGPTRKTQHQMSKCVLRLAQSGPNNRQCSAHRGELPPLARSAGRVLQKTAVLATLLLRRAADQVTQTRPPR